MQVLNENTNEDVVLASRVVDSDENMGFLEHRMLLLGQKPAE